MGTLGERMAGASAAAAAAAAVASDAAGAAASSAGAGVREVRFSFLAVLLYFVVFDRVCANEVMKIS